MNIINLTPHDITITVEAMAAFARSTTVPASGQVARCRETCEQTGTLIVGGVPVPVMTSILGAVEGLPEPTDGTVYLVSRILAEAAPLRRDLYFPGEAIRDSAGRIVGCRGLCQIGGV